MASLALLGSLLVSIVLARSRYVHQWRLAQRRVEAIEVAHVLLRDWAEDWNVMPRSGEQTISNSLVWRVEILPQETLAALDAEQVRLSILDAREVNTPAVLAQVDVVLPVVTTSDAQTRTRQEMMR